jgi:hypothetical protein
MPAPSEHKTVQARILAYAQEIGWACVSRNDAEQKRGFYPAGALSEERARKPSLFFGSPGRQLMTARLCVHALDLPEPTSFTVKNAR